MIATIKNLIHQTASLISTDLDFNYIVSEGLRIKGIELVIQDLLKLTHDPQISGQLRDTILNQIKLIPGISVLNNKLFLNNFSENGLSEVAIYLYNILNDFKIKILAED